MELITLETFKSHVRIDDSDEDPAAAVKVAAANAYVSSFLAADLPIDWEAPADLVQATLMIAAHWWESRETALAFAGTFAEIPIGAGDVIANYREWQF